MPIHYTESQTRAVVQDIQAAFEIIRKHAECGHMDSAEWRQIARDARSLAFYIDWNGEVGVDPEDYPIDEPDTDPIDV